MFIYLCVKQTRFDAFFFLSEIEVLGHCMGELLGHSLNQSLSIWWRGIASRGSTGACNSPVQLKGVDLGSPLGVSSESWTFERGELLLCYWTVVISFLGDLKLVKQLCLLPPILTYTNLNFRGSVWVVNV